MLSERTQPQRTTYQMIPFIGKVLGRQIHRDRKPNSGCQALAVETGS